MESIKNAIVTITLLAVGYGSYVVLQDDLPDTTSQTSSTTDSSQIEGIDELTQKLAAVDRSALSAVAPAESASPTQTGQPLKQTESPLPDRPFGEPLVANQPATAVTAPPEDILLEVPDQPMTGQDESRFAADTGTNGGPAGVTLAPPAQTRPASPASRHCSLRSPSSGWPRITFGVRKRCSGERPWMSWWR